MPSTATIISRTRRQRGLTQQQLADRAGVSRHTIMRIERGESPNLGTAVLVSQALGVGLKAIANLDSAAQGDPAALGLIDELTGLVNAWLGEQQVSSKRPLNDEAPTRDRGFVTTPTATEETGRSVPTG